MTRPTGYLLLVLIGMLVAACQPDGGESRAFSVTLPPEDDVVLATPLPTQTPPSTRPPSATPTTTSQATATATDIPPPTNTPEPARENHYRLARPFSDEYVDYYDRTYAYGDTQQGNWPIHHGVDFANPRGTPVLAAASGTVVYAGDDIETLYGPQLDFYGRLVIIEHDFDNVEGQPIYTLYGHLERVDVFQGQEIESGHIIGLVGDSGVAIGPHLHFEVRAGAAADYGATRNPDLWLMPYRRFGTLAGLVVDAAGDPVLGVMIQVREVGSGRMRYAYTYAGDSVNSSPAWGENFTHGDLPWGEYEVIVSDNGRVHFRQTVRILSEDTTWVDIRLD
jgi:murein DD-endopeptidase MepM/ murein hydrolase activator NlpD